MSLREALLRYYDLKTVKMDLVRTLVGSVTEEVQQRRGEALVKDGVRLCACSGYRLGEGS